jgi:hypothetical protein
MAGNTSFWERVGEEVRSVSDRTRRGAKRALQMGVLRVDLVSLRRDRSRALADLGERVLTLWKAGTLLAMESDAEVLRLRSRIVSIEELIEAKRVELERLREEAKSQASTGPTESPVA